MITRRAALPASFQRTCDAARPLIFGEILYDLFEDGRSVLGGAPFNVAWHLRGLGQNPLFISRLGQDGLGERALAAMTDWGLDTTGIQIDGTRPTGTVRVSIDRGQPRYEIPPDQAFDFIDADWAISATAGKKFSLLHHGSLAVRSPTCRKALNQLIERLEVKIFLDPNLRSPWWEMWTVRDDLKRATWAKLNGEELTLLPPADAAQGQIELASKLRAEFDLELLIVTLGADGAFIVTESDVIEAPAAIPPRFVDTVGAGDAFDAVVILGLIHAWPLSTILKRAAHFTASVCGIRGATAMDEAVYQRFLDV